MLVEGIEISGSVNRLPGSLGWTLSGGTRSRIKLSRPWQVDIAQLVNPAKCIFCNMPEEQRIRERCILSGTESLPGWDRLINAFTPHPDHHLIISDACWPAHELQGWGGKKRLHEALTMGSAEVGLREKVFLINVGMQAGQNLGHPHMHVFTTLASKLMLHEDLISYASNEACYVCRNEAVTTVTGGVRAGECLLIPIRELDLRESSDREHLASAVSTIIEIGNEKFRSDQGLSPAYGIIVRIAKNGILRYATYSPTLHCWGALEFTVSPLEAGPYVLPWPHEVTAEYLRS